MFLSPELHFAIEQEIASLNSSHLVRAYEELSQHYRQKSFEKVSFKLSKEHCVAYAASRMPATYEVAVHIFTELFKQRPELALESVLDIGAGPGTCAFALSSLHTFKKITLLEKEFQFLELGKRLFQSLPDLAFKNATWHLSDAANMPEFPKSDLTIASYSLGEMNPAVRQNVLAKCLKATQKIMIVIEPGTPQGYTNLMTMRTQIINQGSFILAPCPHQNPCPINAPDWCHFSKRLPRERFHRLIKNVELNYEDEKYCYLVASPDEPPLSTLSRIIKKPMKRPGHIYVDLCTSVGLKREVVPRSRQEKMRQAKKAKWGDSW